MLPISPMGYCLTARLSRSLSTFAAIRPACCLVLPPRRLCVVVAQNAAHPPAYPFRCRLFPDGCASSLFCSCRCCRCWLLLSVQGTSKSKCSRRPRTRTSDRTAPAIRLICIRLPPFVLACFPRFLKWLRTVTGRGWSRGCGTLKNLLCYLMSDVSGSGGGDLGGRGAGLRTR